MTDLAAIFDQQSPFEHDVFGYRQDALLEHRPNLVGEPVVEFGTTADVSNEFDAESYLGESHRTYIEEIERLRSDEGEDFA